MFLKDSRIRNAAARRRGDGLGRFAVVTACLPARMTVCMSACPPGKLSTWLARRLGAIGTRGVDIPRLNCQSPACWTFCLLACLPACRFGPSGIVCALLRRAATKPRHDQVTSLQLSTVTPPRSPVPPPFPGFLSLRTFGSCSAVRPEANASLGEAQGFKALDPFGLTPNGGLAAGAQGCSRRASRRPLTPYGVLTGCPVSARGLLFGGAETGR